ncbi:hypothetical protein MNBD_NITROSPINAE01-124 [hydrothermal vent metagenome]|uniref:Inner membrane protein YjeT (Clustered with HflC) n=1 Tax=hydrothermal vent metagenome TaxID=652676 RepID=A0A3B1CN53_9ZZZZ
MTIIGVVMILEGIPYFTMPKKVKEMAEMILSAEPRTLRYIGFGLMIGGLVFVAFGRSV